MTAFLLACALADLATTNIAPFAHQVSTDLRSTDWHDLEPLGKAIQGADVVVLGEASHGDGGTFRQRARIIKYLHEQQGYDVLLFESDLVQGLAMDRKLAATDEPVDTIAANGTFPLWGKSKEALLTFQYLKETKSTKRPMTVGGFDFQPTNEEAGLEYVRLIKESLGIEAGLNEADMARLDEPLKNHVTAARDESKRKDVLAWLDRIQQGVTSSNTPTQEVGKRAVMNFSRLIGFIGTVSGGIKKVSDQNPRDAAMADNLLFHLHSLNKRKKIIVWAATFHFVREIESIKDGFDYTGMKTAGMGVSQAIGKRMYVIGFSAYDGKTGIAGKPEQEIGPAPTGSLEGAASGLDGGAWFFDLRDHPADGPLAGEFVTRVLGHSPMTSTWKNVVDGVFVVRAMSQSSLAGSSD